MLCQSTEMKANSPNHTEWRYYKQNGHDSPIQNQRLGSALELVQANIRVHEVKHLLLVRHDQAGVAATAKRHS